MFITCLFSNEDRKLTDQSLEHIFDNQFQAEIHAFIPSDSMEVV